MRPVEVVVNSQAFSQWVPIDYISAWFGVSLGVVLSEDATLTYSVQFTLDALDNRQDGVSVSRTTTTATVTDAGPLGLGHGLSTGDNVIIKSTGSTYLDSPLATYGTGDLGVQVASTPTNKSWTYAVTNAGASIDTNSTTVVRLRVFTHATLVALTARANGTLNYPVSAVRLNVTAYTSGFASLRVLQGNAS
jgi:hypothetical protein